MTTQEVPALVASLASQVKMIPISWRIEPTCVTIVFEQGPKLRFEVEPKKPPPMPVSLPKPKPQTRVVAPPKVPTPYGMSTKVITPARKRHSKS